MQIGSTYKFNRVLSIHITDTCNEKCIFCVVGIPEISIDKINQKRIKKIIMDNAFKGYEQVNLHGGEPTVFKGIIDILKLIKLLNYPTVSIQTNGQRMKDMSFTKQLKKLNVDLAIISLHGKSPEVHDNLTQSVGGFSRTIHGIKNALDIGMKVRTNTVITKQNIHTLPEIIRYIYDLGVRHVNISNIHPVMTAFKNFEDVVPTIKETQRMVSIATEVAHDLKLDFTLEGFPYCLFPNLLEYYIEAKRQKVGLEIRNIWIDDYFEFMDTLRIKGEVCQNCIYKNKCGGVYNEYIIKRGWSEFQDPSIYAPVHC
jgi:MoaA/NifB/PqqE/SkfB family radical SAM enzyme